MHLIFWSFTKKLFIVNKVQRIETVRNYFYQNYENVTKRLSRQCLSALSFGSFRRNFS